MAWNHHGHSSVSAGYMRSSIFSVNEHYDPSIKTSFEIDDNTLGEVLNLFKALARNSGKLTKEDGSYWQVTFDRRPARGSHEVHGGYRFEVSYMERRKLGESGKVKTAVRFNVVFSLVPSVYQLRKMKAPKLRWFLNVASNPSKVLTSEDMAQVRSLDHHLLEGYSKSGPKALTLFHTLGYWLLEELGDLLVNVTGKGKPFRWPEKKAIELWEGQPSLLEVSYSFFSQPMSNRLAHEILFQLGMVYEDNQRYLDANRRIHRTFNLGDWLSIEVGDKDGRKVGTEGIQKLELLKKYDNRAHKSKLTFEPAYFMTPAGGKKLRMKYSLSLFSQFFNRRVDGIGHGFRVADFVEICLTESPLQDKESTAFDKQYSYVTKLWNEVTEQDFMLTDLMSLDLVTLAKLPEWVGDNAAKQALIDHWYDFDSDATITDTALCKKLDVSRQTLYNYRQQLKDLGFNPRLPMPAYILMGEARRKANETVDDKLKILAFAHFGRKGTFDIEKVLRRSIEVENKLCQKVLAAVGGNSSQLFDLTPLPAIDATINSIRQLTETGKQAVSIVQQLEMDDEEAKPKGRSAPVARAHQASAPQPRREARSQAR